MAHKNQIVLGQILHAICFVNKLIWNENRLFNHNMKVTLKDIYFNLHTLPRITVLLFLQ